MYRISVFGSRRTIPSGNGFIHLDPRRPLETDDESLTEYLRHFPRIQIEKIEPLKSVRSMTLEDLRGFARSKGVGFDHDDSRTDIMKKLREVLK